MAGEMYAKLLLNSKDFDTNLRKSKKNAEQFKQQGTSMGEALAKSFAKVTAAALTVQTAGKVFNTFINSSQSLADSFAASVDSAKNVAENFVYSLANADFSSFTNGLDEMIRKSKEAYAAYDQLGNTVMASSYIQATSGNKYREAMVRARNKELSIEERQAALEEARAAGEKLSTAARVTSDNAMNALRKQIAAEPNLSEEQISDEAIQKYFELDATQNFKEQRKKLEAKYKEYLNGIGDIKDQYPVTLEILFGTGSGKKGKNQKAREELIAALGDEFKDVIVGYQLLFRESDEELAKLYETAKSAVAAKNQVAEIETSTNEVGHALGKEVDEIRKHNDELRAVMEDYRSLHDATMLFDTSMVGVKFDNTDISKDAKLKALVSGRPIKEYRKSDVISELPGTIEKIELPRVPGLEGKNTFNFDDASEGVLALTSAFSELNSVLGSTDDEMGAFIDNIFKSIDAIVPFISAIIAESNAHKANAQSAATDAVAKGMEAHAGIPFAGIPLGIAAAASIIATVKSIPKFAEGGIVTSATLGVFGEAGPEAVMPLDKLKDFVGGGNIRVTGEFRQRGKDLVATINSYNQVQRVK